MINNYASLEHKIFSTNTSASFKARDNKEKIATIYLAFSPATKNPNGGKGKVGDWANSIDFQLDESAELVDFGLVLCGRKQEREFPYHNGKKLTLKRNSNGSLYFGLSGNGKNHNIIANDTDNFHLLILTCTALGNRYGMSQIDALQFLQNIPLLPERPKTAQNNRQAQLTQQGGYQVPVQQQNPQGGYQVPVQQRG